MAGFALLGFSAFLFDFEALLKSLPFTPDPDAPWYNGILGFGLFSTLAICISCPRQVVSLVAGFFFGLWSGFLIALFAATFSCVITYALSILMRDHVSGFVSGKISIAVDFWAHNTFLATLVWRFIPAGSNLLTNLAAGALSIPMVRFVTGSAIGYIPHTLVFASLGSGLQLRSGAQIAVSIGLFLVAAGIGAVLVRRYQKQMRADNVNRA
ncbi:MAG: VTT domain-containing protein [Rhizobiaceae bacterium]|nr:VTT domain-containing protein [Rhizobiaceae bacterium]